MDRKSIRDEDIETRYAGTGSGLAAGRDTDAEDADADETDAADTDGTDADDADADDADADDADDDTQALR
ncbi:MAG TPA: hypothetical protein VHQ65_14600 [Thermoanaerobaculia bacterium]|nr:hypothetical protein [Thermoanaerobaculia bacterium]